MKKIISKLCACMKEDNRLRVKKSYYTFSREYPAGNIPIKRRKNRNRYPGILKSVKRITERQKEAPPQAFTVPLLRHCSFPSALRQRKILFSPFSAQTRSPARLPRNTCCGLYPAEQYPQSSMLLWLIWYARRVLPFTQASAL